MVRIQRLVIYFLFNYLLNDAVGSSDYVGSDDWVIEHNELEIICKDFINIVT
jgi:hypothetical protein